MVGGTNKSTNPVLAQVRSCVKRLAPTVENEPLGRIDGEFYWRCCHPNVGRRLDDLRSALPRSLARDPNAAAHQLTRELNDLYQKYQLSQSTALDYITGRSELTLRGWSIYRSLEDDGYAMFPADLLWVKIGDPNWTGERVEQVVREWWVERPWWLGGANNWDSSSLEAFAVAPYVDSLGGETARWSPAPCISPGPRFELRGEETPQYEHPANSWIEVDPATGRLHLIRGNVAPPFIEMTVDIALSPHGHIAEVYNRQVCGARKWTNQLAGLPTRQKPRTALRTWVIALLIGSGMSLSEWP